MAETTALPRRPSNGVLAASLIGSVVQWYDLFVYGTLVFVLSKLFFPSVLGIPSLILALIAFVAGAAVRPLGGAVFGRLGDLLGRRAAFVLTTFVMGVGSISIGLLPTYDQIGALAPVLLVSLRVVQGLALGGEYGGGVVYIAENTGDERRGLWTSTLQVASTLGLLLATGVVLGTYLAMGPSFLTWGWRLPFLGAAVLLLIAVVARLRLAETLLYQKLVELKRTTRAPLSEALGSRGNLRKIVLALAVVSGASVVWHTAQFYTQVFLQNTLHVPLLATLEVMGAALALAAPFYLLFGALSDRIGRLRIILAGSVLGALTVYPTFWLLSRFSSPLSDGDLVVLAALVWGQLVLGAMCYAPLGAYLVELFPGRIRYTSISITHGVGTGDIGDATVVVAPVLALALAATYGGLLWCVAAPLVSAALVVLFVKEPVRTSIWREVERPGPGAAGPSKGGPSLPGA